MVSEHPMDLTQYQIVNPSLLLTTEAKRRCAMKDFADGVMGDSIQESAAATIQRIDALRLWPVSDADWASNWGQFCCMLNDLVEPPSPSAPAMSYEQERAA